MTPSLRTKFLSRVFLPMTVLMLAAPASYATPILYTVVLNGPSEIPANPSPGTGLAAVLLDAAAETLQINVTFSGLLSPDTAAHIHCCLASPFFPGNASVATTTPAFPGFPLGVTAGTYNSPVFDLTQALIYNPAFVTSLGGIPQAEAALIAGIQNGETYMNIHTGTSPGGEIRGFLVPPATAVPEPASVTLVLAGSALLGGLRKIRRRFPTRRS